MKKLLEEIETLMQIVNDAGQLPNLPPALTDLPIYKPKLCSKNLAKKQISI